MYTRKTRHKKCERCGEDYTTTSTNSKYCEVCRRIERVKKMKEARVRREEEKARRLAMDEPIKYIDPKWLVRGDKNYGGMLTDMERNNG